MRICYFGIYQKDYARNKNIIVGLRANGVEVLEVSERSKGIGKYFELIKRHWQISKKYDLMIVGFPGQIIMPLAKIISRKPIIFDAHVSLYDANVFERHNCGRHSIKALWFYLLDWISCHLADRVLLDTEEHAKYFVDLLHLRREKIIVVYHGADTSSFHPIEKQKSNSDFIIEFHGYVTPLHGLEYVLEAMATLKEENIQLWIIGAGQNYGKIKKLAANLNLDKVSFFSPLRGEELLDKISQADLGLGILGKTDKVDRVIPNKLYELMATKIPVLSADTKAVREQFQHGEHLFLCPKADAEAIAGSILFLKNNKDFSTNLVDNAYNKITMDLSAKRIGSKLIDNISNSLGIKIK